ncbi:MAG: nucleoside deaminase [Bryobacteraceae bacterium]|nr:nucleoside deaminase [Bryobacteraceae bacterium]
MDSTFLARAIELAVANVNDGLGGPFGAVVVRDGRIVAEAANSVIPMRDPTAHAEVVAIRRACQALGAVHISGCDLYTSCEPCPMCLGAVYWAHIDRVYFAATQTQAAEAEFDDSFIYNEIALAPEARSVPMIYEPMGDAGLAPFRAWLAKQDRIRY